MLILQEEYQAYMSKKSQKRQSLIVSLSDKNLDDLQKLQKEKDELMKDFEDRKSCMLGWIYGKYVVYYYWTKFVCAYE